MIINNSHESILTEDIILIVGLQMRGETNTQSDLHI